jgi:hypothetical protein
MTKISVGGKCSVVKCNNEAKVAAHMKRDGSLGHVKIPVCYEHHQNGQEIKKSIRHLQVPSTQLYYTGWDIIVSLSIIVGVLYFRM